MMRFGNTRGEYEAISRSDSIFPREGAEEIAMKTEERATHLASEMLAIEERQLSYTHLVTKWEYASYAFCIAASLSTEMTKRRWLAQEASWTAGYALALVDASRTRASQGKPGYQEVVDFLERDEAEARIRYLNALGLAIRMQTLDPVVNYGVVRSAIAAIPRSFQHKAPPEWNPWFQRYLTEEPVAHAQK
jgi:hypothetical protein